VTEVGYYQGKWLIIRRLFVHFGAILSNAKYQSSASHSSLHPASDTSRRARYMTCFTTADNALGCRAALQRRDAAGR